MTGKYKLLLFGAYKTLITEFFVHMDDSFEMLGCTGRVDDVRAHLKYYKPDAAVMCLADESRDELMGLNRVNELMHGIGGVLIVIGDRARCDEFERMMPRAADNIILRSRTSNSEQLEEQLRAYLDSILLAKKEQEAAAAAASATDSIEEALAAAAAAVEEALAAPAQAAPKKAAPARVSPKKNGPVPRKTAPGGRRHVLVVDDDSGMLKMIKEILSEDYDVATAISGKVALKFLETRKTDIVLLDYEMPIQSGAQVYEKILENPESADIPVVFLTGVSDRERIAEVLAMKPRGYLLKPIDTERLKKTIEEIVG